MHPEREINKMVAPIKVVKVAAICGSLRRNSYNRGLVRYAMQVCEESIEDMQIEFVDISPLPLLNTDLEVDGGFPPEVEDFRAKIRQADSILFACPEYNLSIAAPMKNAIDWASRPPNAFADKAAAVISAAGTFGGALSQHHLRQVGVFLNLHFLNKPELWVQAFNPPAKFDCEGNLIDNESKERLKQVLLALKEHTLRLAQK